MIDKINAKKLLDSMEDGGTIKKYKQVQCENYLAD
jgi:hypothetical protein